jgi:hypothetical protein
MPLRDGVDSRRSLTEAIALFRMAKNFVLFSSSEIRSKKRWNRGIPLCAWAQAQIKALELLGLGYMYPHAFNPVEGGVVWSELAELCVGEPRKELPQAQESIEMTDHDCMAP